MVAFAGRTGAKEPYYALMMTALCLSLAGDVLLIFEDRRTKAAGGAAFLFAHAAYIAAFFVYAPPAWYDAALFAVFALTGAALFAGKLKLAGKYLPLAVTYAAALCAMTAKALSMLLADGIDPLNAAFAAAGGALFALSDLLLAIPHFRPEERIAGTLTVFVYYAAQALLALSIAAELITQRVIIKRTGRAEI
jgi:uncharacterized membrane protein YhhN